MSKILRGLVAGWGAKQTGFGCFEACRVSTRMRFHDVAVESFDLRLRDGDRYQAGLSSEGEGFAAQPGQGIIDKERKPAVKRKIGVLEAECEQHPPGPLEVTRSQNKRGPVRGFSQDVEVCAGINGDTRRLLQRDIMERDVAHDRVTFRP